LRAQGPTQATPPTDTVITSPATRREGRSPLTVFGSGVQQD
jgi:hypothetical protein